MSYQMFFFPYSAQFRRAFSAVCTMLAILLVLTSGARAQSDQEHQAYVQAVTILTKQAESAPLERLVQRAASDYLKRQGLEWLVVNCLRRGETARAKAFAEQLLSRDTDNALALAVTSDAITQTAMGGPEKAIGMVKRALRGLPQLKAPELMEEAEFLGLRNWLEQKLNGAVGYAYYQQNDYVSARNYLRKAVALAPENAQYAYALAICDLLGRDGDEAEGYRLLAHTVNLTQGTPSGQELASFARRKYEERGGSSSDWDRYLAATRLPATSVGSVTTATKTQQPQWTSVPSPKLAANQPAKTSQPMPSKVASGGPAPEAAPLTDLPPAPPVRREIAPPRAAFSLGILIQTSKASHQGKRAVINTLSDMVRHLRDGDEAFLVSFAHNVVFEEDLTGNAKLLKRWIKSGQPQERHYSTRWLSQPGI
jgi:tetratricopeptide (TPR) repeat protein